MNVTVEIHGFLEQRSVHAKKKIRLKENETLEAALAKTGKKIRVDLVTLFTERVNPVIMLNNMRVDMPADLSKTLNDGDAIIIMQPLAGG